jgi:hypothetical protein
MDGSMDAERESAQLEGESILFTSCIQPCTVGDRLESLLPTVWTYVPLLLVWAAVRGR